MKERIQDKYDAFISYRHAELDSYVAETLQKELEAFRLPKNLVKEKHIEKDRINRVFRDKTELPIAANLSDPIEGALQVSDFLLVICTPRLKESIWCQKEIDRFIELHGRERVLAVLAEGEPADSFPEQILKEVVREELPDGTIRETQRPVEPLAADVRGKDKKEIHKKIKEEVLRLAAPMFDCAYDDIKQRHREQRAKRIMSISLGISAVVLAFGCFSGYQAFRIRSQADSIKKQSEELEIQYQANLEYQDKLEEQFYENLEQQKSILITSAERAYEQGELREAQNYAVEVLNIIKENRRDGVETREAFESDPMGLRAGLILGKIMRVYDDGRILSLDADVFQDTAIEFMLNCGNNRIITIDSFNHLRVWNILEQAVLYEAELDNMSILPSASEWLLDDYGDFYYVDDAGLHKINTEVGEESWSIPEISYYDRMLVLNSEQETLLWTGKEQWHVVDNKSGKILSSIAIPLESKRLYCGTTSADGNAFYLAARFDNCNIVKLDSKTLEIIQKVQTPATSITCITASPYEDVVYVGGSIYDSTEEFDLTLMTQPIMMGYDSALKNKLWQYDIDFEAERVIDMEDQCLIVGVMAMQSIDRTSGKVLANALFEAIIKEVCRLEGAGVRVLLENGWILTQHDYDLRFTMVTDHQNILDSRVDFFSESGPYFYTVCRHDNRIRVYDRLLGAKFEETDLDAYELREAQSEKASFETIYTFNYGDLEANTFVKNGKKVQIIGDEGCVRVSAEDSDMYVTYPCRTKFISRLNVSEDGRFLILQFMDGSVDVVSTEQGSLVMQMQNISILYSLKDMDEKHLILYSTAEGYVINVEQGVLEEDIHGLVGYDAATNSYLIETVACVYSSPKFTVEELYDMAK